MYDAIVVFGGGVRMNGTLPPNSHARVACAVDAWKRTGPVPLVMSGRWSTKLQGPPARTEADAMAACAEKLGVPGAWLRKEEESMDTIGNAYFVKVRFVIPNRWRRFLVVVAGYHRNRTEHICRIVFGPDYTVEVKGTPWELPASERQKRDLLERALISIVDDWIHVEPGDHEAVWRVMTNLHPAYSKTPKYSRADLDRLIEKRMRALAEAETHSEERAV